MGVVAVDVDERQIVRSDIPFFFYARERVEWNDFVIVDADGNLA